MCRITRWRTSIGAKCNRQGHFLWKQQPMWSKNISVTHEELCPTLARGDLAIRKYPQIVIEAMKFKFLAHYSSWYNIRWLRKSVLFSLSENNLTCSDKFRSSGNQKITISGKSHNRWRSSVQRFWLVIFVCARKLKTDQQPIRNSTMTSLGLRHGRVHVSWISTR